MAREKTTEELIALITYFNLPQALKLILQRFEDEKLTAVQAAVIAAMGTTTNLSPISATYADLAAARASVNTLKGEVEVRLDNIEAKIDAILAGQKTAKQMATT